MQRARPCRQSTTAGWRARSVKRPHAHETQHDHADTDRQQHQCTLASDDDDSDCGECDDGQHLHAGAGIRARQQDLTDRTGRHHESTTALSGRNADQANQNVSTWATASSRVAGELAVDRLAEDVPRRTGLGIDEAAVPSAAENVSAWPSTIGDEHAGGADVVALCDVERVERRGRAGRPEARPVGARRSRARRPRSRAAWPAGSRARRRPISTPTMRVIAV